GKADNNAVKIEQLSIVNSLQAVDFNSAFRILRGNLADVELGLYMLADAYYMLNQKLTVRIEKKIREFEAFKAKMPVQSSGLIKQTTTYERLFGGGRGAFR